MHEPAFAELLERCSPELTDLLRDVAVVCLSALEPHPAPGELAEAMLAADRSRSGLEGHAAVVTARFAESTDWARDGQRNATCWLAAYTKVSRPHAGSLVRTARTLAECPHVSEAHRAGRLSPDVVRLLLGVRQPHVLGRFAAEEQQLVEDVAPLSVAAAQAHLLAWLDRVTDEVGGRPEPDVRNRLSLRRRGRGRKADGEFDETGSAVLENGIDGLIKDWRASGALDGDPRTTEELWGDALVELVARGVGAIEPARASVIALIDADTLAGRVPDDQAMPYRSEILGGGPVAPDTLRRLACNAGITPVFTRGPSEPLDVGRTQRLATAAIRKAVWVRSGGVCEVCHHTRLSWCQVHHIRPWTPADGSPGGPTSLDNSALVCTSCHHLLHEGRHTLERTESGFRLRRPDGSSPRLPSPTRVAA